MLFGGYPLYYLIDNIMAKLVRMRSDARSDTEIFGYGKQPIVVKPYSNIALVNYNILLKATPENSTYPIRQGDNVLYFNYEGDTPGQVTLTAGDYSMPDFLYMFSRALNMAPTDRRGLSTNVTLTPTGRLLITSNYYPSAGRDWSDTDYLIVQSEEGGAVVLGDGVYDATATTSSVAVFISEIILGSDGFQAAIVTVGNVFEWHWVDEGGVSVYGAGYDAGGYYFRVEGQIYYVDLEPEADDDFSIKRSGNRLELTVVRGVNTYPYSCNLPDDLIDQLLTNLGVYEIRTDGPVSLIAVQTSLTQLSGAFSFTIDPLTVNLANLLGFAGVGGETSANADPSIYSPINAPAGSVDYQGIMVCLNGVDMESYDLSQEAAGQTNFVYTIQNQNQFIVNPGTIYAGSNRAVANVPDRQPVGISNSTSINLNNTLSVYFLDTASGKRLQFVTADLLFVVTS